MPFKFKEKQMSCKKCNDGKCTCKGGTTKKGK